ncbi:MAG: DUF1460 domain-containing protein [Deltaproteobacteria bacterium]|nr:DUF1460 domain-containing protein [Deltaproteobacteria bacterium]
MENGGRLVCATGLAWVMIAAAAAAGGSAYRTPESSEIDVSLEDSRALDVTERISSTTERLVGARYVLNPLGEGDAGGPDSDPRLRYDAFDCTTFVETALALALVDSSEQVAPLLDAIRYRDAVPSLANRRHFPAAEWIPDLVALGFLDDITHDVAGDAVVAEVTILNSEIWDRRRNKILSELPEERIPDGRFRLDIWPLAAARAGYRGIPSGTVLSTMRVDRPRLPVRITHQGLVIVENGKHFIRHAADEPFGRVVDEPLADYLDRISGYREWQVVGIHLARVQEPDDWRRFAEPPHED